MTASWLLNYPVVLCLDLVPVGLHSDTLVCILVTWAVSGLLLPAYGSALVDLLVLGAVPEVQIDSADMNMNRLI